MRTVTTYYARFRFRSVYGRLSWHFRNELGNQGYLDLQPCYRNRRFRIRDFLEDATSMFYRRVEPMRFTEADWHLGPWSVRFRPWGDDAWIPKKLQRRHSKKEISKYVGSRLTEIVENKVKYDTVQVMYLPYGGLPLVCISRNGRVTIL